MAIANKKRYYFVEVNIPDAVKDANPGKDPSSIMVDLLEEWKNSTGTKHANALYDFIYEDVKSYGWHPTESNKMAYCLTFINARHFDNYKVYTGPFRTWLNDTHGIAYTHEVSTDVPFDVAEVDNGNDAEVQDAAGDYFTYAEARRKAIVEELAESRGFELN